MWISFMQWEQRNEEINAKRIIRRNGPFPSSPGPLFQNEVKYAAFDMEIIFLK